jgi:hypothetical protein
MRQVTEGLKKQRRRKSAWLASSFLIPKIISVASAVFSAALWPEARQQRLLAFDPTIVFDVNTQLKKHHVGIGIRNVGPSVARIDSITYLVDGKRVEQEESFSRTHMTGVEVDRGNTMSPAEVLWLLDCQVHRDDQDDALDFVLKHVEIIADYSTAAGVHKHACSRRNGCAST